MGLSSPISKSQIRSFPKKSCLHVKTTLFVDKQGWDSGGPLKEWANSVQRPTMNKTRCDDELFVRYLVSIIYTQQLSCRGTSIRIVMSPMPYIYDSLLDCIPFTYIIFISFYRTIWYFCFTYQCLSHDVTATNYVISGIWALLPATWWPICFCCWKRGVVLWKKNPLLWKRLPFQTEE